MLQNGPLRLQPFHYDANLDPVPAFHSDADPDPNPASQNNADPRHWLNIHKILWTQQSIYVQYWQYKPILIATSVYVATVRNSFQLQ